VVAAKQTPSGANRRAVAPRAQRLRPHQRQAKPCETHRQQLDWDAKGMLKFVGHLAEARDRMKPPLIAKREIESEPKDDDLHADS
jgi:hypothetical protein